jgi:hypothetical protein
MTAIIGIIAAGGTAAYVIPSQEYVQQQPTQNHVNDYATFVGMLKALGAKVEKIDHLDDSPFSVPTRVTSVNGETIQVYEFETETDAKAATQTVSDDGTEIGTSMITWIGPPHFYAQGKIIVLYTGENSEISSLLEDLLGPQFAGF